MENCLFCKIALGEIPSYKIDETNEHLAFLDIFPNTKGMTLVIPKKHFDSDVFSMPLEEYDKLLDYAKKVVKKLEKKLNSFRVALVIEGMGVNHAHVKLYPLHGLDSKFKETWHHERVFFEKYPGFITTKLGPEGQDIKRVHEEVTRKR
jgi:diadenosine tetraphosphate (Ap4A) HIT family hydrolase